MKFTSRRCRLVAAGVMPLALAGGMLGLAQSTASAAGKGAQTTTSTCMAQPSAQR